MAFWGAGQALDIDGTPGLGNDLPPPAPAAST